MDFLAKMRASAFKRAAELEAVYPDGPAVRPLRPQGEHPIAGQVAWGVDRYGRRDPTGCSWEVCRQPTVATM